MSALDTIVAPATAHGVGSVAIVRLSGANALKIAQKLLISQMQNLNQTRQNQSFSDGRISSNSTNSCDIKKIDTKIDENYSQNSSNLVDNLDAQNDKNLAQISHQNSVAYSQILHPRYAHFKQIFIEFTSFPSLCTGMFLYVYPKLLNIPFFNHKSRFVMNLIFLFENNSSPIASIACT